MFPTPEDYREYGRKLGREFREENGKINDWIGFVEMKRVMLGHLSDLRQIAGYDDRYGAGTYKAGDEFQRQAYEDLLDGFREAAT